MYKVVSAQKIIFDLYSKKYLWTFDENHFIGLSLKELEGFFEIQNQNGLFNYKKIRDFKYKNERYLEFERKNLNSIEKLLIKLKKELK